jgi:hypothetical protein
MRQGERSVRRATVKVKEDLSQVTCAQLEQLLDKFEGEIRVHAHSTPSIDISGKGDERCM